ncbi:unnamed protein product, partial [Mesorhabditis belari]|uniref:Translation initiation factor eIF2B subunit beta n=1 Tax=Mesorhabditis belari TaxID=2138241 RepID=A0AAF3ECL8_9BILA
MNHRFTITVARAAVIFVKSVLMHREFLVFKQVGKSPETMTTASTRQEVIEEGRKHLLIEEGRKQLLINLRRRTTREPSFKLATDTLNFLRKVVLHGTYNNLEELLALLRENGLILSGAYPSELVMRNLVLMVCKLARESNSRETNGEFDSPYDSLNKLWKKEDKENQIGRSAKTIRKKLIQAVNDIQIEMETCREHISAQGQYLVHMNDVLIVHSLSTSTTLSSFLAGAKKDKKTRVFSVQIPTEPDDHDAVSISLCEVAGKMCEATKVILSGATVFPDGSCLAPAGGLSICLAAHRHSVPVYVLCAFYKIAPFFVPDSSAVIKHSLPGLPVAMASKWAGRVRVLQPALEMIPANLITLFVSNTASIMPSHIYRLIGDYYHPDDVANY